MKLVILFTLAAVALAQEFVEVIEDTRNAPDGAVYSNILRLDNGVEISEQGSEGSAGQSNSQGSYTFISPEGETVSVSFTADEGGFQPQSDALPLDHPTPAHVEELLRIAERQKAEGIVFDDKGFRI